LELSTTTAPASDATGLHLRETEAGVLDRTISTPSKASGEIGAIGWRSPRNVNVLPALRSEARNRIEAIGYSRSSSRRIIRSPTAPLAPITATCFTTRLPTIDEGGRSPDGAGSSKRTSAGWGSAPRPHAVACFSVYINDVDPRIPAWNVELPRQLPSHG